MEKPDRLSRFALRWSAGRGLRFKILFTLGAIIGALGLRLAVHGWLPAGYPFVTFFPAIILTAFFAGARAGLVVAVATGLAAWGLFLSPEQAFPRSGAALLAMLFFAFIAATDILLVHVMTAALRRVVVAEARSSALARSRTLMFNELQHRVSNNIATIGALLHLQERRMNDPKARASLADARARLDVVARLQRRLHDPARQAVDIAEYIAGLAYDTIFAMDAEDRITVACEVDPLHVDPHRAMPIGLVASELMMNACEHALPPPAKGMIVIRLAREAPKDLVRLTIMDDGRGLPDGFSLDRTPSLGLTIARQFADQLGGRLTITARPGGGTRADLVFPLPRGA